MKTKFVSKRLLYCAKIITESGINSLSTNKLTEKMRVEESVIYHPFNKSEGLILSMLLFSMPGRRHE